MGIGGASSRYDLWQYTVKSLTNDNKRGCASATLSNCDGTLDYIDASEDAGDQANLKCEKDR